MEDPWSHRIELRRALEVTKKKGTAAADHWPAQPARRCVQHSRDGLQVAAYHGE